MCVAVTIPASLLDWQSSYPRGIVASHFSFTISNNRVTESLTMLQVDNFPADGSIITGLYTYLKTP